VAGDAEIQALREATRGREDVASQSARVRLGELVNAAVEQRRQRDAAEIIERLKPVSIAAVMDPIEREFMVLNAPFLVDRDHMREFEKAVEGLARDYANSVRLRLLGPMPCYNFLDVEQPAWA
jgi:Gas vesicle synthesis protein GvpL/GvpF